MLASLRVTFGIAFAAALIDVAVGLPIAWALTRYEFPGRRIFDAVVDLPFALPTAVAGIALSTLYAPNGWFGAPLAKLRRESGLHALGHSVALVFVGLPFVVRTVEPIIRELEVEWEEASATLGASRWQTIRRVVLPELTPALLTGMALAFARGVGEYGSVIFIAGNVPYLSEITPLLIVVEARRVRLCGRDGDRRDHAGAVFRRCCSRSTLRRVGLGGGLAMSEARLTSRTDLAAPRPSGAAMHVAACHRLHRRLSGAYSCSRRSPLSPSKLSRRDLAAILQHLAIRTRAPRSRLP